MVDGLEQGIDYQINSRHKEVELSAAGREKIIGRSDGLPRLFRSLGRREELARQALVAREFFLHGKQYAIIDNKIVIVDEFTGRLMPMRSWRAGLHQAVEAKEGIEISDPTETLARLSFQRFFRLFKRLSGMTGTAREAAGEFWQIYKLPFIAIPTHKPCQRKVSPDRFFSDEDLKWQAVVETIVGIHATGRPILVGTRSITASQHLAALLRDRNLEFNLLNALYHAEEARIVSEAGQLGRITIATNMAGRGTDIRLGPGVAEMGGLHVIATERHESRRIDRQLFGRSARQGDPGSAQAFVCFHDELLQRYLPAMARKRLARVFTGGSTASLRIAAAAIAIAQKRAERQACRQRASVLKMDTWLEEALSFAGDNSI
jgi:preprotein translocase subunit SecA